MFVREYKRNLDDEWLSEFDASFSTEYIYRATVKAMAVELRKEKLDFVFRKSYSLNEIKQIINASDHSVVAEFDGTSAGFATVKYEAWNKRTILTGIFVTPESKGKGVGRAVVNAIIKYAKTTPARCLWLETQNVNYPAIRFYLKQGFEFCGFDQTLYNPADISAEEIALYFAYFL